MKSKQLLTATGVSLSTFSTTIQDTHFASNEDCCAKQAHDQHARRNVWFSSSPCFL